MSLTINAKTFTADSFNSNAVGYIGSTKTVSVKDDFVLRRITPSPVANFSGVAKGFAKLTRTLTLTGALTPAGDGIIEVRVSVPVGAASADVDALLNDTGAYLSSASGKTWAKTQQISY
jgi:hypothetical protein